MMKQIFICLIVLVVSLSDGMGAEKTVRLAGSVSWPPYYGEELPHYGIAAEIISAAYERRNYRVRFAFRPWARVLKDVENGKFDGAAIAFHTQERAGIYRYSEPYMKIRLVLYRKRETPVSSWRTLEDLKPYSIGVERGSVYSPEFDRADFLRKEAVTNDTILLKKLIHGRNDLIAIDLHVARYLVSKEFPEYKGGMVPLQPFLSESTVHVMFTKKGADIQEKLRAFNDGLKAIAEDGTLKMLRARHGLEE